LVCGDNVCLMEAPQRKRPKVASGTGVPVFRREMGFSHFCSGGEELSINKKRNRKHGGTTYRADVGILGGGGKGKVGCSHDRSMQGDPMVLAGFEQGIKPLGWKGKGGNPGLQRCCWDHHAPPVVISNGKGVKK